MSDQIRRLVSATCLARLTVPSVSEIVRLAASSLLIVSRADLTIIGWPVGPTAMAWMAIGLIGLTATVFPLEPLVETMVCSPFRANKNIDAEEIPQRSLKIFLKYAQPIAEISERI
ncbi:MULTISPECIES: hypothetical protein [Mesorhizobium]|uniref:Uncharacterized protein n=1 Tax=Mesorhizobium japonicum R7A TaxID=935547 RepID=A0ABX6MTA5_9HYPH|nr:MULTISPECIES: hypothetical protein [Mesorhizobium]MBE1706353.1 hypothetical protein [Mesorhizobium japonicum]MUT21723.1 hypothetical protein [Mesorhizobium japonicum]MUT27574.1 hypothetical protein [Mesorhizobium japonicum]QJF01431.1 hypothetical protein R7A2020_11085 [Mesorhizobium japonicum R7A]QJF07502.1 hypothetical protein HID05_11085 [Mesorhizobium japonicum]